MKNVFKLELGNIGNNEVLLFDYIQICADVFSGWPGAGNFPG